MWWKKGRFIFKVGNITKPTKKSLVDTFLVPSMEHIYYQAKECHLFDEISEVGGFLFTGLQDTYYNCIDHIEVFILDKNNQLMTDFVDQVSVSLFQNDILLNTWEENPLAGSPHSWIPIQNKGFLPNELNFDNLRYEIRFKEVVSTSEPFSLYRICDAKFSTYPEKITYGETISISITEEELSEDQTFNYCDAFDIYEAVQGWEGRIKEEADYTLSYTCPPESELENALSLRFILHRCNLYEADIIDEIYIQIEDATVGPTEGFDDVYIFGGEDDDYGASIAAGEDPTEIFITGKFAGSAAFVDTDLLSDGPNDVYIGKWNYLTNNFEWLQKMGSPTEDDSPRKVAVNVGITEIDCVMITGDEMSVSDHNETIYLLPNDNVVDVRMGFDGKVKWILASGQTKSKNRNKEELESRHYPRDSKIDQFGNSYILGYYKDNISFTGVDGVSNWSATGNKDFDNLFLVKISNNGEILWGYSVLGLEDVKGRKLLVDSKGNVYISASYDKSIILDGYDFEDDHGAFIAKLSPLGELIWIKDIKDQCFIYGMVMDKEEEHLFISGVAGKYCDFAGMVWETNEPEYSRLFFTKFSTDGEPVWIKHGETTSERKTHWITDMAIDDYNNFYLTGYMREGILSFSNISLIPKNPHADNNIIFAAAFDENGEVLWADTAADNPEGEEDNKTDKGTGIIIDGQNNCYITGTIFNQAEFSGDLITGYGNKDAFIARVFGGEILGLDEIDESIIPENILLFQNYPNPFKERTRIDYRINQKERVEIIVFNTLGEKVKTLVNDLIIPGDYSIRLSAQDFNPGIYYYQLKTKNKRISKKMILIR